MSNISLNNPITENCGYFSYLHLVQRQEYKHRLPYRQPVRRNTSQRPHKGVITMMLLVLFLKALCIKQPRIVKMPFSCLNLEEREGFLSFAEHVIKSS